MTDYQYSSRIHPKDGVVYYNLVIVEGEPVGGFYVDEDDAIEGALGIVNSLGGTSDQFRDVEDGHLDHEAIADWILNDDRVAYCDLARSMVVYE
jgi:hypothetical protein